MRPQLRTLDDVDVEGRRVLLRVDFNVPLVLDSHRGGVRVAEDSRIQAALPTIAELRRRGARVVLAFALESRGAHDEPPSMQPVAARLAELSGSRVRLAPAVIGPQVRGLT